MRRSERRFRHHAAARTIFAPPTEGPFESDPREIEVGLQDCLMLMSTYVERGYVDFVLVD